MRVALCLTILLAGCLSAPTPEAEELPEDPVVQPEWLTMYLHADGTLSPAASDAGRVTLGWGYQQWIDGTPAPAWGGPFDDLTVLAGNLTLFYEANAATLSGDVRPELTAWWGSEASLVDHQFIDGPDTVQAGDRIEATSQLYVPAGGLSFPNGTQMMLRVGSYYVDGPLLGNMDLLVGADTPSRIDLLVQPFERPALTSMSLLSTTGTVTGGRCAVAVNPTEEADSYHTVEVSNTTWGFTVRVDGDGQPTPDIDLVVYGPNGTVVGGGHSSYDVEGADIWKGNLDIDGPGTYQIRVLACTPQQATYTLDVVAWNEQ